MKGSVRLGEGRHGQRQAIHHVCRQRGGGGTDRHGQARYLEFETVGQPTHIEGGGEGGS